MLDQAILDRLGPWTTRFKLHGQTIGGSYEVSEDDPLLRMFTDRAPMARRVLELGCMEGGRTFPLARRAGGLLCGTVLDGGQRRGPRHRHRPHCCCR